MEIWNLEFVLQESEGQFETSRATGGEAYGAESEGLPRLRSSEIQTKEAPHFPSVGAGATARSKNLSVALFSLTAWF
jgi:hypothetical protein